MITWNDVIAIAPELNTASAIAKFPPASQAQVVTDVTTVILSAQQFSSNNTFDLACKYLCAHIAALAIRGAFGSSGPVTEEQVGDVSRSYASNSPLGTHPDFDLTPYGKRYRQLLRALPARIGIVP